MPEITSSDNVKAKLREFDELFESAIDAAKKMVRLKTDAEKMEESIQVTQQKSAKTQEQLQNIKEAWNELKDSVLKTQADVLQVKNNILEELDEAKRSLGEHLTAAEERLRNENAKSLIDHTGLKAASCAYAEKSADDSKTVMERANQLEQLITSFRKEVHGEIKVEFSRSEELIQSMFHELEKNFEEKQQASLNSFTEKTDSLNKGLDDKMTLFKETIKKELFDHQAGIERQVTEFLNKQNLLVQNLTQQIDGFQRSAQTLSTEQSQMQLKILEMEKIIENTSVMVQQCSSRQGTDTAKAKAETKKISERLEQTIALLKTTISGRTFKNL